MYNHLRSMGRDVEQSLAYRLSVPGWFNDVRLATSPPDSASLDEIDQWERDTYDLQDDVVARNRVARSQPLTFAVAPDHIVLGRSGLAWRHSATDPLFDAVLRLVTVPERVTEVLSRIGFYGSSDATTLVRALYSMYSPQVTGRPDLSGDGLGILGAWLGVDFSTLDVVAHGVFDYTSSADSDISRKLSQHPGDGHVLLALRFPGHGNYGGGSSKMIYGWAVVNHKRLSQVVTMLYGCCNVEHAGNDTSGAYLSGTLQKSFVGLRGAGCRDIANLYATMYGVTGITNGVWGTWDPPTGWVSYRGVGSDVARSYTYGGGGFYDPVPTQGEAGRIVPKSLYAVPDGRLYLAGVHRFVAYAPELPAFFKRLSIRGTTVIDADGRSIKAVPSEVEMFWDPAILGAAGQSSTPLKSVFSARTWSVGSDPLARTEVWRLAKKADYESELLSSEFVPAETLEGETLPAMSLRDANRKAAGKSTNTWHVFVDLDGEEADFRYITIADTGVATLRSVTGAVLSVDPDEVEDALAEGVQVRDASALALEIYGLSRHEIADITVGARDANREFVETGYGSGFSPLTSGFAPAFALVHFAKDRTAFNGGFEMLRVQTRFQQRLLGAAKSE